MNDPPEPPTAPGSGTVFLGSGQSSPAPRPGFEMSSQRLILVAGFVVLAMISAVSIALDVKSRSDVDWVNHTQEISGKMADLRFLFRRAEGAARGYLLTGDQKFEKEYSQSFEAVAPALTGLKEAVNDNVAQLQLLASTEPLVASRFVALSKAVVLRASGDAAATAILDLKADGRALMESVDEKFYQLAMEEQRLLAIRSLESARTGRQLRVVDLSCAALILILAAILVGEGRRSSRKLERALRAAEATKGSLEAAVAERTQHLLAAHEKLRSSASVLESLFASMTEAVLVVDSEGEVFLSNSAAERLLHYLPGMTAAQLRAQNVTYKSDGSTQQTSDEELTARALRSERFDGLEIVVRRSGSRDPDLLLVGGGPLHDAIGVISGAALIFRDITAARETERKLHQSQKLDAIGKLTGGVAHDFNNMLTVISGTIEILVADLGGRPERQATAALINQATDRCTDLIRHLLAFARKQPLQPRNIDIGGTVLDIAKLLWPTLGEQIEIESILEGRKTIACVDPSQLANALVNLAINARDAMPNGGRLMLETESVMIDEAQAQSDTEVRPGVYVVIAVSDTGTGMSADLCEKVFEPFFTTKEPGKGTGMGLSMVYGFAKQSGGHVKVYSEEGHGTTIRLYLPAVIGCVDKVAPKLARVSGGTETVLVVEDDTLVRGFVVAQLRSLGYTAVGSSDCRAALAQIESGRSFDLLVTDVVLPGGMTGRQLADEMTRRRPEIKVLYTSGYTENAILGHEGCDGGMLLSKPYRKPELARMMRLALASAAARSPEAGLIPLVGTSFAVPMRRQPASSQALFLS
jgi:PAS domain S-box-containing protein